MTRLDDAKSYYQSAMQRLATTPPPVAQKYPPGTRVRIADDLGLGMSHFPGAGKLATVNHTYAHAYGGDDVKSYCLDIDGYGCVCWYYEAQLKPTAQSGGGGG